MILVYITTSSQPEARRIAEALVSDRLAACANIIPGMTSVYRWQGKIDSRAETVLILKTQDNLYPALESRVKALHGDETPCIIALPASAGNPDFLHWIETETGT